MKLFMICICALSLSGCARLSDFEKKDEKVETVKETETEESKESIVNCANDGMMVRLEAQDDKVNKFTQTFYMSLEELKIDKNKKEEEIQELVQNAVQKLYQEFLGVNVTANYEDNRVKIVVEVDYEVANLDALVDAGLLNKGEVESQYVSLEMTKKDLESQGFACEIEE